MRTGFDIGPEIRPWPRVAAPANRAAGQDRHGAPRRRLAAVADDIAELSGRAVVYVLAMLGLLHLLGLVAAAP